MIFGISQQNILNSTTWTFVRFVKNNVFLRLGTFWNNSSRFFILKCKFFFHGWWFWKITQQKCQKFYLDFFFSWNWRSAHILKDAIGKKKFQMQRTALHWSQFSKNYVRSILRFFTHFTCEKTRQKIPSRQIFNVIFSNLIFCELTALILP